MFDSIGWGEILVIIVAGLFILGPERLPGAIQWVGKSLRKVREYATGARDQLRGELGPEFDELREPLEQVRSLRTMGPRRAITQHLLDGYDPVDDARQFDLREQTDLRHELDNGSTRSDAAAARSTGNVGAQPVHREPPLAEGERPPFDPDAT